MKKSKIVMLLSVAVIALIGIWAIKSSLSDDPDQTLTQDERLADASDEVAEDPVVEPESVPEAEDPIPLEDPGEAEELANPEEEDSVKVSNQSDSDTDNDDLVVFGQTITYQAADYNVIPDIYNCGAKGNLTKVLASDTVNGIQLYESGGINVFDFFRRNKEIQGEIHFNSYDFSDYIVAVYNDDQVDRDITLVFENCKFSTFRALTAFPKIHYVFNNCTFNRFLGSCAEFNYCKFGDLYLDGIIPYHDVTVRNCYISNFSSQAAEATGGHTDGTQLYGKEGIDVKNVKYENCRFEMPCVPGTNSINACIMLQMEFSNGIDISFNNCICNGGGYTIYATSKDKGFQYYQNVVISNIAVGQSRKYGPVYPTVAEGVEISNVFDVDSLYVASVWKANGKTHLSVTNDTLQDRLLIVYADGQQYEFAIPASRGGQTDHFDRFEDYPIDLDICIEADCKYLVCFDGTLGVNKQIRYVTWD